MKRTDDLPRAQELIARCLNGVATDAEGVELNGLLVRDPEVATAWARAASHESDMEVLFGPDADETGTPTSTLDVVRPVTMGRRGIRRAVAGGAVAAACALLAVWFWRTDRGPSTRVALARVQFSDGSTAELQDDSSRLEEVAGSTDGVDIVLQSGVARFQVVPRAAGRRFRVLVGGIRVDVLGTIFTVERQQSGARVSVERGVVTVTSGAEEEKLLAGTARLFPFPVPPSAASPATAPVKPTAVSAGDSARPQPQGTGRALATPRTADGPHATGKRDEAQVLLEASDDARKAGHPEEARQLLERLLDRHPRDPQAPYAAFILGRVLLEELHLPREAASAFARVTRLEPRTPLAPDALAREAESWFQAGEATRASDRAGQYLSRYPDGRRKDQVRRYSRHE